MSLRYHEISEARHRILNPFTDDKLDLLGSICQPAADQRVLDLACGKGELLCRWADRYRIRGVGVDISDVFLTAAHARAEELHVNDRVRFLRQDAATYASAPEYDIVSCIGATWIGGGLVGTLDLMKPALAGTDGLLLVGEPYWTEDPPADAYTALEVAPDDFTSLVGTLDRFADAGCELIEMVLADGDSWDRYAAAQWHTVSDWLRANPDDPDTPMMRATYEAARRSHLAYGRRYLGWGVFVLRAVTPSTAS